MISVVEENEKMGSYALGKQEAVLWALTEFDHGSTCLDVGACDGIWQKLLGENFVMDAVEAFEPNAQKLQGYRTVYNIDIDDLKYEWYDLIIFGDVIEHMEVEKAQRVLNYAYMRCEDMIVAVPWMYEQGELYGNKWEIHIQDDLTKEKFMERYPGFEPIVEFDNYAYFHKSK